MSFTSPRQNPEDITHFVDTTVSPEQETLVQETAALRVAAEPKIRNLCKLTDSAIMRGRNAAA